MSNQDTDQRETNTTRLTAILNDAALRLLYREFLRETLCEENLAFYLDVEEFNHNFHSIDLTKPDAVRETLAAAYGMSHPVQMEKKSPFVPHSRVPRGFLNRLPGHLEISQRLRSSADRVLGLYNAFLAPGSPCELNIDHTLRQDMASRMTRAVAKDDAAMYGSLKDVQILFDRAQQQVFKLMAGVSFYFIRLEGVTLSDSFYYRTLCPSSFVPTNTSKSQATSSKTNGSPTKPGHPRGP